VNDLPSARPTSIAWTIVAASFGFAVVQLDVTIVNVALPRLSVDLAASVPGLQWVVDAYSLVFAVLLLSAGVMGDRLGARPIR
jgi:DHA2 family methylenomycin A resistance protein-like MFS transporter